MFQTAQLLMHQSLVNQALCGCQCVPHTEGTHPLCRVSHMSVCTNSALLSLHTCFDTHYHCAFAFFQERGLCSPLYTLGQTEWTHLLVLEASPHETEDRPKILKATRRVTTPLICDW